MQLMATIPHSGEKIPELCTWLRILPEVVLMCDVDRYVDRLYENTLLQLKIPFVKTEWHRFAVDLNRIPSDVDQDSVLGSANPSGSFPRGFHWSMTTLKEKIMRKPISFDQHEALKSLIYDPFHRDVQSLIQILKSQKPGPILHLDLHSMPSVGTSEHRDPGQRRADIVISDSKGKSAEKKYVDWTIEAYTQAGFNVEYNWPYFGGRLTEQYGRPSENHHTIQVELNRSLYMNEKTKQFEADLAHGTQQKLKKALELIHEKTSLN